MPSTISVTVGRPAPAAAPAPAVALDPAVLGPPVPAELPELPQAARPAARAAMLAAPAIALRVRLDIGMLLLSVGMTSSGVSGGGGLDLRRRPPGQQAPFQQADQGLGGQRQ